MNKKVRRVLPRLNTKGGDLKKILKEDGLEKILVMRYSQPYHSSRLKLV